MLRRLPRGIGSLSSHYTIVITLHDTACGCVINCHVASDCHVASHTPALLVFVTRPSILGPTALLPHTHLCFACVCDQAVNIGSHTCFACETHSCLWLCHRLPCCLTPALLVSVTTRPHTCFACVCDQALLPCCLTPALLVSLTRPSIWECCVVVSSPSTPVNIERYCHVASHLLCLCL